MRLAIDKAAFLKALQHVTGVVERKSTIPILSNVLISAEDGRLSLRATDLDIEVIDTLAAETITPGATTVSAHLMHDIVRKLPDAARIELSRDADEGRITLSSGRSRFSLSCLSAGDFPDLGQSDLSHRFSIPAGDLRRLIERTRFAISSDDSRYYLHGIYLHVAETQAGPLLRAVTTDGHRLAQMDVPLPEGALGMPGVIVPRKTVMEAHKLVADKDMLAGVELSENRIRFLAGDTILTSKLIDGTFPDYARVIPAHNDKVMRVANALFIGAVDRVSTMSSEKGRAVKLEAGADKLTLSVTNPDSGSATEEIPAEYSDTPLEIGFNARYLLDISSQFEAETLEFKLSDPSSPAVIQDAADGSSLYVLMPMRV